MNPEPTIRAVALLHYLDLLDSLESPHFAEEHNAGRHEALHQVRVYVTALIEPDEVVDDEAPHGYWEAGDYVA